MPDVRFKSAYLTVTLESDRVELVWSKDEPSDDHAAETARTVTRLFDEYLSEHPGTRLAALLDLTAVKAVYPRATGVFSSWILAHRENFRGGAFATKSLMLRASIAATALLPGITLKGFGDAEKARRFLQELK